MNRRPYTEWEDYAAGMFDPSATAGMSDDAAALLKDPDRFYDAAVEMLREWPVAAAEHLASARGRMYHPWIGSAACCYATGATQEATRLAWRTLTESQQSDANAVADRVADEYRMGVLNAETLFG